MNRMSVLVKRGIPAVVAILITAATAWSQVEEELSLSKSDLPIFPNALIILDTSGSMAEVPYRTASGEAVPVGTRRWNEDVLVDANGEPDYDDDGNLQWITDVDRIDDPFAVDADANVFLTGGNHPASKLYKAKLALNRILAEVDSVNLGFATGLQLRLPRVKKLFYRTVGDRYEFRWILTPGMYFNEEGTCGNIDRDTCAVTPHCAASDNADDIITDRALLSEDVAPYDPPGEIRCAPIPLDYETFPALPKTPSLGEATMTQNWLPVDKELKGVELGDGTFVDAYPTTFDYSLIWYPNPPPAPDKKHPHSWSYASMDVTGPAVDEHDWHFKRSPYYPEDAESPEDSYLDREFVPGTEPAVDSTIDPIPELSNYFGDDHLAFVHLPDPSHDDNTITVRARAEKILSFLSLARVTDPTFDCRVASTDGSGACEFCPNGKNGSPYRQFTCMPFTNSVACGGYTPLGNMLNNAREYYLSYFDQDLKSRHNCRENCVILFTDGAGNCSSNDLGFSDGDSAAMAKKLNNLVWHEGQSDAVTIPVKTYVMGFGLDPESKKKANEIAAAGGTERAYFATTVGEIGAALQKILGTGRTPDEEMVSNSCARYGRSDPVIVGKDAVYAGFFEFPSWRGHLKKYRLVENWQREEPADWYAPDLIWYDGGATGEAGDFLDGDAGAKLDQQDADSRIVYTADSSNTRLVFSRRNAGEAGALESAGLIDIGFASGAELVDKIRTMDYADDNCYDDTGGSWKLGDIYHSTPVVVGSPLCEDLVSFADRTQVVLVGANDGMLHAFDDSDGTELWSFVPHCLLGKIHRLKDGHAYCVDLTVKATDAAFDSGWRTVLMGGLREGGHHYFALDITDTTNPLPLWEVTDSEMMGQTWSTPSFGLIPGDQYVAFVGGGYDPSDNKGSSFFIIDLQSGTFVKQFSGFADADEDFPAQVRAVDLDHDSYIERVYFVSTKGKLYRLLIDPKRGIEDTVTMIFDPGDYRYEATEKIAGVKEEQSITRIVPEGALLPVNSEAMRRPVYYAPAVMRTEYQPRNYLIHYGTGDERAVLDIQTQDFFYEIEDRGAEAVCPWVQVLDPGEKCLSRPMTFDHVVYFTTYNPGICNSSEGFVYGLTVSSRLKPRGTGGLIHDLDGRRLAARKRRVEGIVGIPSSPQVANGAVIGNSSRNPTHLWKLKIDELHDRIRSWQEVF